MRPFLYVDEYSARDAHMSGGYAAVSLWRLRRRAQPRGCCFRLFSVFELV